MHNRIVTAVPTIATSSHGLQIVCAAVVPVGATDASVYKTVDFFEHDLFGRTAANVQVISDRVPLRSVINLHNDDGIRDLLQIEDMVQKIRSGHDMLHASGLPNTKLVWSKKREKVLFDGHHSMLAYMACGRTFLDEIPHLEVYGERGFVTDEEILAFFGPHSIRIRPQPADWRRLVVNWQMSAESQLCERIQGNMGELFDSISERLGWGIQAPVIGHQAA